MTTPPPRTIARALRAIVVASWFPAVDDTTKGRFVADQVEALRATDRVEPVVVSFEPAQLSGGPVDRRRQASAVRRTADGPIRYDPAVFAPEGWTGPTGIPVARLPVPSGGRGVGAPAHHAEDRRVALAALAARLEPDGRTIIHAHTGYPDGSAAAALMAPLAAPLVITEHATFIAQLLAKPDQRRAYVQAVRRASRLIVVSRSLADELRSAIPECESKLVVIPNTVAMEAFWPGPIGSRRPDELLYVGYRTETKGIDVLLAAFAAVRAARPGVTLRLIGRSPNEETEAGWQRLAGELGVADAVRFDGPALRTDVAAAMAGADILVHASRRETFGVAPVEALASGLPVVAADTGPLREILGDDGRLGALVPPGDPAALAAAILATLQARASFDPVVLRNTVEERYSAPTVARRLVELYEEVLGERGVRTLFPEAGGRSLPMGEPADRAGHRTLLVGFATAKVARILTELPASSRSGLALVCSADDLDGLPSDLGAVWSVAGEAEYGPELARAGATGVRGGLISRGWRFVRSPRAAVRRRRIRSRRDGERRQAIGAAIDELVARSGPTAKIDVICLDGLDYLMARPALEADRVQPVPGAIRWLADRAVERASDEPVPSPAGPAAVGHALAAATAGR